MSERIVSGWITNVPYMDPRDKDIDQQDLHAVVMAVVRKEQHVNIVIGDDAIAPDGTVSFTIDGSIESGAALSPYHFEGRVGDLNNDSEITPIDVQVLFFLNTQTEALLGKTFSQKVGAAMGQSDWEDAKPMVALFDDKGLQRPLLQPQPPPMDVTAEDLNLNYYGGPTSGWNNSPVGE